MRKTSVALLVGLLSISLALPAYSAPKASAVTAAFKTLLNTTVSSMDALDEKYESDIDALDLELNRITVLANTTYDSDFAAATMLYSPQIAASNLKISEARNKFASVSSVRVLNLGTNRGYWGNLNCPLNRQSCIDVDKGRKFIVGEVTTILQSLATLYTESLPEIDIMISQGLIELLNPAEFIPVTSTLKNEPANQKLIASKFSDAQTLARNKQTRAIQAANNARDVALADLDEAYESAQIQLEAQETAASLALLAARRASRDANVFDSAFAIAFKFEYNRLMVGEIADAAWTGEWTFRTIDSIMKVNRLAVSGDSVASRYSMSSARAFNSVVGNAFTNEPEFRSALKVLTAIYKRTTKVSLKV